MSLLETRGLTARYGDFQALFGVDIRLEPGETVAIIGANGAGKTTLMRAITGVLRSAPDSILYRGAPIGDLPADAVMKRGIAMVPEGRRLFPSLSVEENLLIGAQHKGGRDFGDALDDLLTETGRDLRRAFYGPHGIPPRRPGLALGDRLRAAAFGPHGLPRHDAGPQHTGAGYWSLETVYDLFPILRERRHSPGTALSGGQQQMVAIGRALISNPDVLLCDEISLGLAPVVIRDIYAALPRIKASGASVIVVEQDIGQALAVADRVYCMMEGRVTLTGKPSEIGRADIHAAYFGAAA